MSTSIDRVGAFRGHIMESGVGATQNGFPQFTARLSALERWVDSAEEMETFGLTEPGWVDWSSYDQDLVGYFVLFGQDKKNPGGFKPTFHMESLQKALAWDGASLSILGSTDWSAEKVTFWVEENDYNDTITLQIKGIDAGDAPPIRSLRKLDAAGLKDLDSKFAGFMSAKKKAVAPAKPATATKPKATTKPPASKPAATKPTTAPAATPPPTAAPATKGMTQADAWAAVCKDKGAASDDAMAKAWIDAYGTECPGIAEADATEAQWAAVAATAIALLKL